MSGSRHLRPGAPSGARRSLLGRAIGLFRPYATLTAVLVLIIVGSRALQLTFALIIGAMVDAATDGGDAGRLNTLILLFGGAVLVVAVLGVAQAWMQQLVSQGVITGLRESMHTHLQRLSLRFYTRNRTGEVLSRITTDINQMQQSIGSVLSELLPGLSTFLIAIIFMAVLDWRLMIIALITLPLLVAPTIWVGNIQRRLMRDWHVDMANMSSQLEETLSVSGSMLVKGFGRQEYESGRFRRVNENLRKLWIQRALAGQVFSRGTWLYGTFVPGIVYWYGGRQVIDGDLSIGTVVAFAVITGQVFEPFVAIARSNTTVLSSLALFERVFEYLDTPVEVDEKPGATDLHGARGGLQFDHVSFRYSRQSALALDDVSFEVQPGQTVALVGPSGAGKTTTTYLLQRFYDPVEGAVLLDGHDLRDLTLASLPRAMSAVLQETYLFHTTLAENIAYGRLDAPMDDIAAAADSAGLSPLLARLPDGLETVVGERGYRLSGGEKQRVAIARAILNNPPILLLDEATASLDSRLEREIREATETLMHGRTTIVIAHRLSTVVRADQILVFNEGRIVERGRHRDLLQHEGLYASLYREQFSGDALDNLSHDRE